MFAGLRFFEILLHRKYLFSYPFLDIFNRFIYSFSVDFIFLLIFNASYIAFYLFCEWFKKDKTFFFRKIFFRAIHIPLILLFFLDMQTLAVQDRLFYLSLLSALKVEMLINLWILVIDYWHLIILLLTALFIVCKYLPIIDKKPIQKKKILLSAYVSASLLSLFCITLFIFKSLPFQREYRYNGLLMRLVNTIHTSHWTCETTFFSKEEVLDNLKRNKLDISEQPIPKSENIILFVIESLSMKYVEPDLMPFLSNLAHKGIFLRNHLVPIKATVLSIYSLLNGKNNYEPPIDETFMEDFLKAGYSLSFFFGDKKTTFDWPMLFKRAWNILYL